VRFVNSAFRIILIIACVFLILANWHILAAAAHAGCPQAPQSLRPSNPSFSKSEIKKIKNYIRQVYGMVRVTDDVLDVALGESYEGAPLLWWIGLFVEADRVYELLNQGKEAEAFYHAYKFVGKFAFVKGLTLIGLRSVAIIASVAALPIEWAIETFIQRVNKIALRNQFVLYMEARRLGYSHDFILAGNDIIEPHIILFSDPGRWLYVVETKRIPPYGPARVLGNRREEVYAMACALWDLKLHKDDYISDKEVVKEALQRAIQGIPVNRPPIANAGPDQTVQVGSTVQLDGRGSTDPDGDPIKSYRWRILPRENSARCVFKSSSNIAQPTIQPRREGSCTIELVVSDGKLSSAPDQVTITAKTDVIPPALIQDFLASDNEDSRSTLTWTNPSDSDLAEVIVRRKTSRYPISHNDGDLVYQNTNPTPGAAVTHTDTGLTNGTTYYYAVFSRDRAGNWNDQVVEGKNADTGRPGVLVSGLFAGTVETDGTGRVYLYRGGSQWEVISGDLGRGVMSLVKYNNTLYAGTYTGSLYRYENGTWVLMCNPDLVYDEILVLVVYRGNLYIGTFNGRLYRFEGPGSCTLIFDLDYGGFQSAYVEGGYLFLGSIGGSIYRFDGSTLEHIVDLGIGHVRDLVSYQGKLYAALCGNTGIGLYESVDGINWVRVFTDCFDQLEVFQGLLMMGKNLGGELGWALYWFNGTDRGSIWAGSGALSSMIAQGNERLYIGTVETGRGGRVYAYDGNTVTPISEYLGGVYVLYFAPEGSGVSVNAVKVKPQSLRAFAFQRGQLIEFRVEGWDIGWMRVSVFDLSGKLVFHTDWVQNGFTWNLLDNRGQPLANGVYLYVVRVRGFDGREYVSEVRKLVILR
jgi:hypothetical protein